MDLILCEFEFEKADDIDLNYSLLEYDMFEYPYRISIRKNLKESIFEIIKTTISRGKEIKEVLLKDTFPLILIKANSIFKERFPKEESMIFPCNHDGKYFYCQKPKEI